MSVSIETKYKKHSHREHIYELPDTYIGSIEKSNELTWIFNNNDTKMYKKNIDVVPGLFKIFDEILVNAYDQYVRLMQRYTTEKDSHINLVRNIKVDIKKELGQISVYNDGEGIDIELHAEHNIYVPELIFGNLLTSTNYNKNEEKITGGKNGYGAKLTNIFSKEFTIETVDSLRKRKFIQTYRNNMTEKDKPIISNCSSKPYTKITFTPDYNKFNIKGLEDDIYYLFMKRVYDISACTDSTVTVYLDQIKIPCKSFEKYIDLFIPNNTEYVYEKINDRWEIGVSLSNNDTFQHVSFVNGIFTSKGGKHVEYVVNLLCKKLSEFITKKKKINIKPTYIKENIMVFVKSTIVNPAFDSQTKESLTTNTSNFGSKCELSDKFIERVSKCGIIEKAIELFEFKENKKLKTEDGKKTNNLRGIPKLDDANWAGGSKSQECTLILTEGDSAKSMAVAGLSVIGRDKYGVFPLRGKVINVKDKITTAKGREQIINNEELKNIKKILGLQTEKVYDKVDQLRYGRIMIMTDQDVDGSHIKGLIFNVFHTLWPDLMKIKRSFLTSMLTPIVKVVKNKDTNSFYTLTDYENWKKENNNGKGWNTKYYKGLGTSTTKEAKEYFTSLKLVDYKWSTTTDKTMELAFNKDLADDRKVWLKNYDRNDIIDSSSTKVDFNNFINKDLIHFSNYDLSRSIPSLCDGMKTSQRKILYACFKRNLKSEVKVAQLAGYISEHSAYHHGEMSLHGTMIGMAQDYVGSNNINLLYPGGQFGTRILGGKDAASPRYIYTRLQEITEILFNKNDNEILNYLDDDGYKVEPEHYVPILPIILINGSQGVGTGFSTFIPCYNPLEISKYLLNKIDNKEVFDLHPWYNNFTGDIINLGNDSYMSKGKFKITSYKSIEITELPIGTWTDNYKEFLEELCDDNSLKKKKGEKGEKQKESIIKDFDNNSTESTISFHLEFKTNILKDLLKDNRLEKELKLTSKFSITNMHLFNRNGQIHKYTIHEIMEEFYQLRYDYYIKRKENMLKNLEEVMKILNEKVRFINDVINENIIINKRSKDNIYQQLKEKDYLKVDDDYKYLVNMPIYNLSLEKKQDLENEAFKKNKEFEDLSSTSIETMWKQELETFNEKYQQFLNSKSEEDKQIKIKKKKNKN